MLKANVRIPIFVRFVARILDKYDMVRNFKGKRKKNQYLRNIYRDLEVVLIVSGIVILEHQCLASSHPFPTQSAPKKYLSILYLFA